MPSIQVCTVIEFSISNRKLRTSEHGKILINLSVALIALYVVFLLGGHVTTVPALCGLVSALVHYVFLVFFAWTAVEAVYLYQKFVRVLSNPTTRFVVIAMLVAWGKFQNYLSSGYYFCVHSSFPVIFTPKWNIKRG